jgi:branched-chain amino acid transport system substrate-binding protein
MTTAMVGGSASRRRRHLATIGLALSLVVLASACGTRANRSQVNEALGLTSRGGGSLAPGAQDASSGLSATDNAAQDATNATGPLSATVAASSSSGTASNSNDVIAAPASGNGGATDVGVTADSITAANISILTGPVPGLFAGAVNGTDAYFQYQNSLGGVYGRQLKLLAGDDGFDCGTNKALTQSDLTKAFAFVGSFSLFDNCGADVFNANPGVPDVHNALSTEAGHEVNNFSSQPIRQGMSLGVVNYFKNKSPSAVTAAASLIGDVQSAKDSWTGEEAAMDSQGYKFVYKRIYEPTETDFTADIVQMKAHNVQMLLLIAADVKGIARIESAAAQQGWHPQITALGASAYDPTLVPLAGASSVEGDYFFLPTAMYLGEDRGWNKEVDLFLTWLNKTHPNANPDLFTVYGWASARLFVDALKTAGPHVTRAGVLAALRNVHSFDANTLYPPGDPASKTPPHCYIIVQIHGGKFARVDDPATSYRCDGDYWYYPKGTP